MHAQTKGNKYRFWKDMKVGYKIIVGNAFALALMSITTMVLLWRVDGLTQSFNLLVKHDQPAMINAVQMQKVVCDAEANKCHYWVTGKKEFLEAFQNHLREFDALLKKEEIFHKDEPAQLARLAEIKDLYTQWGQAEILSRKIKPETRSQAADPSNTLQIQASSTQNRERLAKMQNKIDGFIEEEKKQNHEHFIKARRQSWLSYFPIVLLMLVSLTVGLWLCIIIAKGITGSLKEVADAASQIASGDLSKTLHVKQDDEVGELASIFNGMIASLRDAEGKQMRLLQQLERINWLQEELIRHSSPEEKFNKIAIMAVELLHLDFCRIWVKAPGDLCEKGCFYAKFTEGPNVCRNREECLHLISSAGRYTHIDGDHRRIPIGCTKIGHIFAAENKKFLTNRVLVEHWVEDRQWARELGLVSFAGYKLRDESGQPIGVLAMFSKHKITPEADAFLSYLSETTSEVLLDVKTEEVLRKAKEDASVASLAKSEFLANMSHEIRTPMTAILGFSEILASYIKDKEQLELIQTIRRNGEHLIGIINDILDISNIESGRLEILRELCSPTQIVEDVVSLMEVRASAKNLQLEVEYDGPIPEIITTSPTQLRQILINLIGNAIKFSEIGTIRTVVKLLDARSEDPKLQFQVIDQGIGISEEQISTLFNTFTQVDSSMTRKYGGTGLGLMLCKRLAEKLHGDITVTSVLDEGSTFTLAIATGPLDEVRMIGDVADAAAQEKLDAEEILNGKTKLDYRILLAEDGPDNQRLISFLLEQAGADVTVANNGEIAYELAVKAMAETKPYDLIVMDMQMPVMNGYEATSKLREKGYVGPIIALTAHAMSDDRQKCLDAGCDDYIVKPVKREKLIAALAQYTPLHQKMI